MRRHLKDYFIPHRENNYRPHALHPARAIWYSGLGILLKAFAVGFALLIPAEAWVLPDVLAEQSRVLFVKVNEARAAVGTPPLAQVNPLIISAEARARDMAESGYFSHQGPGGKNLAYFLDQASYRYRVAGENLAVGFADAESLFNAWLASPSHYANIIDRDYSQLGVGWGSGTWRQAPATFAALHLGDPIRGRQLGVVAGVAQPTQRAGDSLRPKPSTPPLPESSQSPLDLLSQSDQPPPSGIETVAAIKTPAAVALVNASPQSAFARYRQAEQVLRPLTPLFAVARWIQLALVVFFVAALSIAVAVEARRQHYDMIAQTLGLICLLFVLWYV